jgi:hypothetical protein
LELGYIDTPEEWRDLFIMMYAVAGTIVFLVTLLFVSVLGYLGFSILSRVRRILAENVQPAAVNVQATAQNLRGTVEYVSDTAVKPVIKAYGATLAARSFVAVITRISRRN